MTASETTGTPTSWSSIERPFRNGFRSAHEVPLPRRDVYRMLGRLYRKRLAGIARSRSGRDRRDVERVAGIYQQEYLTRGDDFADKRHGRRDLFLIGHRPVYVDGWFTYEYRARLLERAIDVTGGRSVLEIGSGRGALLAMLALARPALELTGIELTAEGTERGRELAADPPAELLALYDAEEPSPEQRAALDRIEHVQGDASRMAFSDGGFDVSYSCLSLEQMPTAIPEVLREMARVTRGYCVFLEPFADANGLLGRAQLRALDYFRSDVSYLRSFGLEPVHFTTAIPQKVRFKTGLLVAKVRV
jgi:SAM-dependent methyltransferase